MGNKEHAVLMLARRKRHVRKKLHGTGERPRLSVFRSGKHIYAQIIDDDAGRTLVASSSPALKIEGRTKAAAKQVGEALGREALNRGIERVCFDRGGRLFHGRIEALADGAREAGLDF